MAKATPGQNAVITAWNVFNTFFRAYASGIQSTLNGHVNRTKKLRT